jgi:hypothetical protein
MDYENSYKYCITDLNITRIFCLMSLPRKSIAKATTCMNTVITEVLSHLFAITCQWHCSHVTQCSGQFTSAKDPVSTAAPSNNTDLHASLHLSNPDLLLLPHVRDLRGAVGLWIQAGGLVHHVTVHQDCIPYVPLIGVHPIVTRRYFRMCDM